MLLRILPAIGHLKLVDIRPAHLNALYANLAEVGIRRDGQKAIPKIEIAPILKDRGMTRAGLANAAGVSATTITAITQGKRVNLSVAESVSNTIGEPLESLFTIESNATPLSVKTILEHHRLCSTILRQAEKEMIVQYNAAAKATPPKLPQTEAECFQPEEVASIRDALEREPLKWKMLTHLLLITGCRRGEIAGLSWDRIDWDNRQIKIDRASLYSRTIGIYEDTTKTSTTRFIKLPMETMALLREYRLWYMELQMMNGDKWENSGYLFVKENGSPMHPDSITDWMGKFANRHGLPRINPHKFRHTMASLLYFSGADAVAVSKRLGHAKVSTTQNIYAHFIAQADEQAAESIADAILRQPKKPVFTSNENIVKLAF
ncbi:MAG: tyrosine-type recombinase/integrase [Defluviitaleaceae bacterium]|nr:tyrosine-type recombinase/integrase [Defluviitaleaceae bacterium]